MKPCGWLAAALLLVSLWAPGPRTAAQKPSSLLKHARFALLGPGGARQTILGTWPRQRKGAERWPVLLAFHGMAESRQGPRKGYLAWTEHYGLVPAYEALLRGPLQASDYGGLVRREHLDTVNAEFKLAPFQGLFVVSVYTPDLLAQSASEVDRYAAWVVNRLLPKVREVWPVADPERTGVDGVSLGGMVALEVGLRYPQHFRTVGAIQPAVRGRDAALSERARAGQARGIQRIRLLSSDEDPLLGATRALSQALRRVRVPHTLSVVPGRHDYAFNRGPGSVEMLRFHDRALRQTAPATP